MPRTKAIPATADMLDAARLFYKLKKSRKEIAARLDTDIRGVTALLNEAERQGLVRISIYETAETDGADRIQNRYRHLLKVMIVPGLPTETRTAQQYADFLKRAAMIAADYFDDDLVKEYQKRGQPLHIGISGGETLLEFVNAVPQRDRKNVYIHVTALVGTGRLHKTASLIHPIVTASILFSRCGSQPGHCEYATVSPYVTEGPGPAALQAVEKELQLVQDNKTVMDVIDRMNSIDVAFVAIGMVNPAKAGLRNKLTMTGVLEPIITTRELARHQVQADFSYLLIRKDGTEPPDLPRFFLTAGHGSKYPGIEFYRHMVEQKKPVVVMGGPFKIPALKAGLHGKLFNVLITDQHSAEQLAKGS